MQPRIIRDAKQGIDPMITFSVSVSPRPQVLLVGISVRTDMSKAFIDCCHLWEKVFAPRMHEISGKKPEEYHGPSYGVSFMLDEQNFEYWATMPASEGLVLPEGMRQVELPAGLYAGCMVPSLSQLGDAYMYLYETWPKTEKKYALNTQLSCFEYYDSRYNESGVFEVYVPVLTV
jgi:predicted transcriptional regulator YdeE